MPFPLDLTPFFSGMFSVPVTFTGAPAGLRGIERFLDETALGDAAGRGAVGGTRRRTVLLPTSAVAALDEEQAITVDGVEYRVLEKRAEGTGHTTRVWLFGPVAPPVAP